VMALHLAAAAGHAPQWLWIKFQAQKTADVGHMWWFPLLCFVGYFNFDPCPAGHQCWFNLARGPVKTSSHDLNTRETMLAATFFLLFGINVVGNTICICHCGNGKSL
jgi:hypothetical protein